MFSPNQSCFCEPLGNVISLKGVSMCVSVNSVCRVVYVLMIVIVPMQFSAVCSILINI